MRSDREVTGDLGESTASRWVRIKTQAEWEGRKEGGLYLVSRVMMTKISIGFFPYYKSNVNFFPQTLDITLYFKNEK